MGTTGCTSHNLVFSSEAMLPLKLQLLSLRVVMQFTDTDENTQVRLAELEALDEDWLMPNKGLKFTKLKWLMHLTGESSFGHLASVI